MVDVINFYKFGIYRLTAANSNGVGPGSIIT